MECSDSNSGCYTIIKMGKEIKFGISDVDFDDRDIGGENSLSGVMSHLSEIPPHDRKFIEGYARGLLFLKEGRPTKAGRVFEGLESSTGFNEFRERNSEVLKIIKLMVDGNSDKP